MTPLPHNPYSEFLRHLEMSEDEARAVTTAILALAYEQHQRNRLAAITAKHRGITLPNDLDHLAEED